jgi:glutaredoxin
MVICPKCQHVRQANEADVPDWQCPACGVAYAKASEAASAARPVLARAQRPAFVEQGRTPWLKVLLALALMMAVWQAPALKGQTWGAWLHQGPSAAGAVGHDADLSTPEIQALAATVRADEITMYSTSECGYCAQAKQWLHTYGFAFTECNMSISAQCEAEFKALGAQGTPYLIVRGQHMTEGFDSDVFLAILRQAKS